MKILTLSLVVLMSSMAQANNLTVKQESKTYNIITVRAEKVNGVNVRLSREITRDDCNRLTLNFKLTNVAGNTEGEGYYTTLFADASVFTTQAYCPRVPVKETIYSESVFIKSLKNENADGLIEGLELIVPSDYKVEVTEVK